MIGAVAGDIIGSVYEGRPIKTTDFPLFSPASTFTDDTVLTVAVAGAILDGETYERALRRFGRAYPRAGYGGTFLRWIFDDEMGPYNSWGNGSAMRVSPVGFAYDDPETVLREAERSAAVTHNHPEGIKGAQATALAVHTARTTRDREAVRRETAERFGYDMEIPLDAIRPGYRFDVSCQGSVPQAITAFLESSDFEGAVRNAVSLGGDSDTLACIAGGIAQAYHGGIPQAIREEVLRRLPGPFIEIIERFEAARGL